MIYQIMENGLFLSRKWMHIALLVEFNKNQHFLTAGVNANDQETKSIHQYMENENKWARDVPWARARAQKARHRVARACSCAHAGPGCT